MAKVSFDEFTSRARCTSSKHRLLDWRDDSCASSADCKVFVNGGATEFRLHLRALCRSSGFFFDVLTGTMEALQFNLRQSKSSGCVRIKMQDGSTVSIGEVSDTLRDLKHRVQDEHAIPVECQRYFRTNGLEPAEISDDWKPLPDCGDTLLLMNPVPWYLVDSL